MSQEYERGSESISSDSSQLQDVMRIGELLVKEGFAGNQEIEQALAIQRKEKELSGSPLGQILVKIGALSQPQLDELLNNPNLRHDIGASVVKKGFIDEDRLKLAIQLKPPMQYLSDYLVQEGLITPEAMQDVLKEQLNAPRLGEFALVQGFIKEEDLNYALKIQKSARPLGEILCDIGVVNPLDLYYVLCKYKKQAMLGETLIKMGYLDKDNLIKVLQEQKHSSESLGSLLVKNKLINQQQLAEALSRQSNIPFKSLHGFCYDEVEKHRLSNIISQKYAEKELILPITLKGKNLTLAILNPEQVEAARELIRLYSYFNFSWILITEGKFTELFEVLYSKRLGKNKSIKEKEQVQQENESDDHIQIELTDGTVYEDDSPVYDDQDIEVEEIVNFIIKYGISNGASDIHIEQDHANTKLRLRIDGVLRTIDIDWLTKKLQEKISTIISRIKIISNLDITERRIPQDGAFRIRYFDKPKNQKTELDCRVATCPAITGENIAIRILDSRKVGVSLEHLNYAPHVLESFKLRIKSSAGIVLVTGPTGSGKSTTLYAALKYIYNPEIKIITAEDPIEYSFPGIMQTQVNQKINLNFAKLMRSFLRMDPDVIIVGEMRDEETAKIGFDAAQTGHLVLSTVHTNDSISSIARLLALNIEQIQLGSCLTCVLAQRLVRKICYSCIQEYAPEEEEWFLLFDKYPSHLRFYRGAGCEDCDFTGFKGRTLLSEIFDVDNEISTAISNGTEVEAIKSLAMEKGMLSMLDDGLLKLQQTTLSELTRVIPHEMIELFRLRNKTQETS